MFRTPIVFRTPIGYLLSILVGMWIAFVIFQLSQIVCDEETKVQEDVEIRQMSSELLEHKNKTEDIHIKGGDSNLDVHIKDGDSDPEPPKDFKLFRVTVEILLEERRDAKYAKDQINKFCDTIKVVSGVEDAKVYSIKGIFVHKDEAYEEDL